MELKQYLNENRFTIAEFGRQIEYNRSFLSLVLHGRVAAGKRLALKIERFTNGMVKQEDVLKLYKEPIYNEEDLEHFCSVK